MKIFPRNSLNLDFHENFSPRVCTRGYRVRARSHTLLLASKKVWLRETSEGVGHAKFNTLKYGGG